MGATEPIWSDWRPTLSNLSSGWGKKEISAPLWGCQQCKRCKEYSFAVGFWMWISFHMTQQKKWRPILCTMRSSYIDKGFSNKKNTRRICSFAVGFFPECWAGHLNFWRLFCLLKKEKIYFKSIRYLQQSKLIGQRGERLPSKISSQRLTLSA